jgi:predicted transcriptional regulator
MLKLMEHNELNQTTLLSFCGLNLKKHKSILDELESNEFVSKTELPYGKRRMVIYKPTRKGMKNGNLQANS